MERIFLSLLVILVGLVGDAIADDVPTDLKLQELVKKLDDSSRSIRQKAESQLLAIGPSVIERLEKMETSNSITGERELNRIIRSLKSRAAVLKQTLPELELPDAPLTLSQAVELLIKQIGHDLQIARDLKVGAKTIHFSANKLSYWSAMIELLNHYQLDLAVSESGRVYILKSRKEPRSYFASLDSSLASPDIAYRINGVTRKAVIGQDDFDLLRINFQVLFAPSRYPFYLQVSGNQAMTCTPLEEFPEAVNHVPPFSPEALTEIPCQLQLISPEFRIDWLISKTFHPDSVDLCLIIKTLEAIDSQEFAFEDWSAPRVSQRLGLAVVTREKVSIQEETISVLMLVLHSDRGAPFESHREWMSKTKIRLTDGVREISPSRPAEKMLEADGTTALRFTFPRPDSSIEDWKLIYQLPTQFNEFQQSARSRIDLNTWLDQESDN